MFDLVSSQFFYISIGFYLCMVSVPLQPNQIRHISCLFRYETLHLCVSYSNCGCSRFFLLYVRTFVQFLIYSLQVFLNQCFFCSFYYFRRSVPFCCHPLAHIAYSSQLNKFHFHGFFLPKLTPSTDVRMGKLKRSRLLYEMLFAVQSDTCIHYMNILVCV